LGALFFSKIQQLKKILLKDKCVFLRKGQERLPIAIGTFLRNVCIVLFLKCHRKKDIADGLTLSFLGYIQCDLFANKNERVAP
jgi:hypothetical protein